ncbi:MAG: lysine biosynthesis protein LysX [Thaumarchaeota archaeon]|nr:lysine biosynthesis protein LysX [Nitrososphaerota archaeon]
MFYDVIRWEEKALAQAAAKKGVKARMVDSRGIDIALEADGRSPEIPEKVVLQRCVSHYRNLYSTAALEASDHTVVNSFHTAWMSSDKLFCTLALAKAGVPTPKTKVAFTEEGVLKALSGLGYPAVLKPVVGSWGRLAALIKDDDFAKAIVEDREFMHPSYQVYYLQEYVKRPPRDIRTFVIGDRTIAAIYRTSAGDWRTNTARGGKAEPCPITKEIDDISVQAAKAVDGRFVGVDLMESPDGYLCHEVNNTTEFKNSVPATGIDIPGLVVDYLASLDK